MGTQRYRAAGVDIEAGTQALERMKAAVRSTHTPAVLADVGGFGGLFALTDLPPRPVLVASMDGVGTKVKLAAELGRWSGIGHDLVNHCVNDILVQGARPLFFLDYLAASRLDPDAAAQVVAGMAQACRAVGCVLLGGETAEMPDVYTAGSLDVVGAVVGLVDRDRLLPRHQAIRPGDRLVGLPSSGPHTNGYTLIRQVVAGRDLQAPLDETGRSLADALLAPHRCYLDAIRSLERARVRVKAAAHITGGGFLDNIPRCLPDHLAARIDLAAWPIPRLFHRLVRWAQMDREEAFRVFNMGIGLVLILAPEDVPRAQKAVPEAVAIGQVVPRTGRGPRVLLAGPPHRAEVEALG